MQRRKQKLMEESPCAILSPALRQQMGDAAVRAAKQCGFTNAGTVEFLTDGKEFFFMEMNTRIQVEHPITELVTGVDLVKQQLLIAGGEKLSFRQEDVRVSGHAIECRINAENPKFNFRPSPGKITALHLPGGPGVRIDSAVYPGCYVENFSTTAVENSVETVEKPINKQVLHTFHRVFNRWKSGASSTLCINSAVSTRCKRHLHFWRILPGKLVKLPPHAPKSCKKR